MDNNEVKIDVSKIPPETIESLARATLDAVKRWMADPETREKIERKKAELRAKKQGKDQE